MKWEITLGDPEQPNGIKVVRNGENITSEISTLTLDVSRNAAPVVGVTFLALPDKKRPPNPRDPQSFSGRKP